MTTTTPWQIVTLTRTDDARSASIMLPRDQVIGAEGARILQVSYRVYSASHLDSLFLEAADAIDGPWTTGPSLNKTPTTGPFPYGEPSQLNFTADGLGIESLRMRRFYRWHWFPPTPVANSAISFGWLVTLGY